MTVHRGLDLAKFLIAEGLCPPETLTAEICIPTHGVMSLRFEVPISVKDIPKIQRLLTLIAIEHEQEPAR